MAKHTGNSFSSHARPARVSPECYSQSRTAFTTTALLLLLLLTLFLHTVQAETYNAQVDYGFGPLRISIDTDGKKIERCQELKIEVGGGFGPYKLASVSAANKGSLVPLSGSDNTSATWEAAVAEGSHVSFNLTDRAGAMLQSPFFTVVPASDGHSCANSTAFITLPSGSKKAGPDTAQTSAETGIEEKTNTALSLYGKGASGMAVATVALILVSLCYSP